MASLASFTKQINRGVDRVGAGIANTLEDVFEGSGVKAIERSLTKKSTKPLRSFFGEIEQKRKADPQKFNMEMAMNFGPGAMTKAKPVVDDIVRNFARTSNIKSIKETLSSLGHPRETLDFVAEQLAKAKDEKVVAQILDTPEALKKLIVSLRGAKKARPELEKAYTAERAIRARKAEEALNKTPGQKGFYDALGELRGELAPGKQMFEKLRIGQEDVDELADLIKNFKSWDFYDKLNASKGLERLLNGELPQPAQLSLLEDVFGSSLVKEIVNKRGWQQKTRDAITEAVNIPRALQTVIDASAVLRQGAILTISKPTPAIRAGREMFRQTFSQKNFEGWFESLPTEPLYRTMKDAGLYIANPNKISGGLSAREERFMSNIAEKIPVLGGAVKASQRAYISYLNKLRVDVFNQLSRKFIEDGVTPQANPETFKSLANFINNATGRGTLEDLPFIGKGAERAAQELNSIFFSPRLIASRVNLLNPQWYMKQDPMVRKEAIKSMGKFIGTGSLVLMLLKGAGAEVETDPRSTDFGKVRFGDTRWDVWGGFQQWVRLFVQVGTQQRKTADGEVVSLNTPQPFDDTPIDVIQRFFENKLSPSTGTLVDLVRGSDSFGNELSLKDELMENFIPLYIQGVADAYEEFGPDALFSVGIPSFFGVGAQTYDEGGNKKSSAKGRLDAFK